MSTMAAWSHQKPQVSAVCRVLTGNPSVRVISRGPILEVKNHYVAPRTTGPATEPCVQGLTTQKRDCGVPNYTKIPGNKMQMCRQLQEAMGVGRGGLGAPQYTRSVSDGGREGKYGVVAPAVKNDGQLGPGDESSVGRHGVPMVRRSAVLPKSSLEKPKPCIATEPTLGARRFRCALNGRTTGSSRSRVPTKKQMSAAQASEVSNSREQSFTRLYNEISRNLRGTQRVFPLSTYTNEGASTVTQLLSSPESMATRSSARGAISNRPSLRSTTNDSRLQSSGRPLRLSDIVLSSWSPPLTAGMLHARRQSDLQTAPLRSCVAGKARDQSKSNPTKRVRFCLETEGEVESAGQREPVIGEEQSSQSPADLGWAQGESAKTAGEPLEQEKNEVVNIAAVNEEVTEQPYDSGNRPAPDPSFTTGQSPAGSMCNIAGGDLPQEMLFPLAPQEWNTLGYGQRNVREDSQRPNGMSTPTLASGGQDYNCATGMDGWNQPPQAERLMSPLTAKGMSAIYPGGLFTEEPSMAQCPAGTHTEESLYDTREGCMSDCCPRSGDLLPPTPNWNPQDPSRQSVTTTQLGHTANCHVYDNSYVHSTTGPSNLAASPQQWVHPENFPSVLQTAGPEWTPPPLQREQNCEAYPEDAVESGESSPPQTIMVNGIPMVRLFDPHILDPPPAENWTHEIYFFKEQTSGERGNGIFYINDRMSRPVPYKGQHYESPVPDEKRRPLSPQTGQWITAAGATTAAAVAGGAALVAGAPVVTAALTAGVAAVATSAFAKGALTSEFPDSAAPRRRRKRARCCC